MAKVFVSYRRSDSRKDAGRIYDHLLDAFGKDNVFKDVDSIPIGTDFRGVLREAITQTDALLVIIGAQWLNVTDENGQRRLDDPNDFVRLEIVSALQQPHIRVIPVLVDHATMPAADDLPEDMRELTYRNATVIRDDPDFKRDVDKLIYALKEVFAAADVPEPTTPQAVGTSGIRGRWGILAGVVAVLAVAIVAISLLNPQPATPESSPTPIATATETARPQNLTTVTAISQLDTTVTEAMLQRTVDALETRNAQVFAESTATAQAIGRALPPSTEVAIQRLDTTATEAMLQRTVDALETRNAQVFAESTATAQAIISTAAPTSSEAVVLTPVTANADWTPVERDFNGVAMVLVPAGCFEMGYDGGDDDETPITSICFDAPFWIDKYEVSNEQFVELGGQASNSSRWVSIPNRPRESVTWFEARDYCNLRGGRLPTEAEWEYAARGPDSLKYPWGDQFATDNLVYRGNSDFRTMAIGSRSGGVSWVGAYDMLGNVWEWASSIYVSYPYDAVDGREDMQRITVSRVRRGGSYYNSEEFLDRTGAAERQGEEPSAYSDDLGFRCAVDAAE
ncbi:MAG: SUMF1/EgtB/PvdO family nonheme iron enzyme [Anaerolineaceae bacterium]|nr:SUMF1/EgtB/PvdO family nonheme iron enzyme [Anaerolineaceae bacterium]